MSRGKRKEIKTSLKKCQTKRPAQRAGLRFEQGVDNGRAKGLPELGKDFGQGLGKDIGQEPDKDFGQELGKDIGQEPDKDFGQELGRGWTEVD